MSAKVYNPELKEILLTVNGKQFAIPGKGFILCEEKEARSLQAMAAGLEIVLNYIEPVVIEPAKVAVTNKTETKKAEKPKKVKVVKGKK